MPANQDTLVKLLDAKIQVIFDLLKKHPLDDAFCILENVKIKLEQLDVLQLEHAGAAKTIKALEAEAAMAA
jgi:hypothetical protein